MCRTGNRGCAIRSVPDTLACGLIDGESPASGGTAVTTDFRTIARRRQPRLALRHSRFSDGSNPLFRLYYLQSR